MANIFCIVSFLVLLVAVTKSQIPDAEFFIDEELKLSTVVGNLSNLPGLFLGTAETTRRSLQYGILNQASQPASLFNITRDGGVLYVAGRIDREGLCFAMDKCVLKLNVLISTRVPSQFDSKVVTVFIEVNDINDNPPEFGTSDVVLEITEGNSIFTMLKITGAIDRDHKEEFKTQNYSLHGYEDVFELSASQTLDGSSEIDLKLLQSLDRETIDKYEFTITAFDGGSPPLQADLSVTVLVTDKNDNPPVFLNSSYSVTLDGQVEKDSFILQVSATDDDLGENGEVTYDFSSLQKSILENTFEINFITGEIFAAGPLGSGEFSFIVEAQDSGYPPLKSQTEVTVKLVNTGNSPPVVTITTLGTNMDNNTVSISEPGGRGMFVAFVDVSDEDNDNVVCNISNSVFKMESVPNKGYKISLQGLVDRENQEVYDLKVNCIDNGLPPLQSTVHLSVKVLDINDNAPKFSQDRYSRTLTEGKKQGEYVLQVTASDKDIHKNGDIRYSMDPNFSHLFSINAMTGVVRAIGVLDRETESVLNFDVFATDQGNPPISSSVQVSVFLEDINDNAPEFDKKVFRFLAREEMRGHRIINTLSAHDKDIGVNGQVEYFFTGSTDGADGMFIVHINGTISSFSRLDREERENYTFSVMARDKGNPPRMSSAVVVIEVTDINDNAPEILFPDTKIHLIPITNVPTSGSLTLISAHDNDAGENGSLKFTIVTGNEDRAFEINQSTGEFKIAKASRLKNHRNYNVEIVVSDRGSPPRANTTTLVIEVNYKNVTALRKEKEEDYIVIVAVVAAVTVVFSTLIIVAICIVFQKDRHSRRRSIIQKTSFQNLHSDTNLSDDDKAHCHVDTAPLPPSRTSCSMDGMSRHQNSSKSAHNEPFFQTKFSFPETRQAPKGKAVSFCMDVETDEQQSSPSKPAPNHVINRPTAPPLSTFCSPRSGPEQASHLHQLAHNSPHTPVTRHMSGVTYAPVSTMSQGDDVTSDTSADTSTSDSGRGNSVDDVNFDLVHKGELCGGTPNFRLSQEPEIPPRKPYSNDHDLPSYHLACSRSYDQVKVTAPDHLAYPNSSNRPDKADLHRGYSGGRSKQMSRPVGPPQATTSPVPMCQSKPGKPGSSHHTNIVHPRPPKGTTTTSPSRMVSWASAEDDASTTTSGSYVINPDDLRMEALVGSDVVV